MNYKPFIFLVITAAVFSCSHPAPPPPPPPIAVNVYTVKKGSAQYYNSYPATITSVNEVEVRPQVAGYITGIFFKEGQHVEAGKKQVDAAKANVSALEVNLRYSTIYAPLSGTIGISQVKIGASVSPGSTLLNTISSDNPIAADVALDENLIPFIEKESRDNKLIADSIFTLTLSDQSK